MVAESKCDFFLLKCNFPTAVIERWCL